MSDNKLHAFLTTVFLCLIVIALLLADIYDTLQEMKA